tara:strand:- start:2147 stop:2389 length:243 start_codon:yes stop_codon:yes gene_type:complete
MAKTPFERSGTLGNDKSKRNGVREGIPAKGYNNAEARKEAADEVAVAEEVVVTVAAEPVVVVEAKAATKKSKAKAKKYDA